MMRSKRSPEKRGNTVLILVRRAKVPSTPSTISATPSHTNNPRQSSASAARRANSAHTAPDAVKQCTAAAGKRARSPGCSASAKGGPSLQTPIIRQGTYAKERRGAPWDLVASDLGALEAVFDRATDLQIVLLRVAPILGGEALLLGGPVKELQTEVELRKHAHGADTGDPDLGPRTLAGRHVRQIQIERACARRGRSLGLGRRGLARRRLFAPTDRRLLESQHGLRQQPQRASNHHQRHQPHRNNPADSISGPHGVAILENDCVSTAPNHIFSHSAVDLCP